jgi:geranylgeranyl diphosphate synthase, type I
MTLPVILERYRSEIEDELKAVVNSRSLPMYDMMRYHLGWTDASGNPVSNDTGKAIRPSLCLFTCQAVGGNYRQALPAAAALELVHNYSLIHDDIQDDDQERRHRSTVWAVWGKPQAINAGTAMRMLANMALLRMRRDGVPAAKQQTIGTRLDEITLDLIEGQYLDISFEKRFDIDVNDYLSMIARKTGALLAGSLEIGALIGTGDTATVGSLKEIGKELGLAFQVRDDILGIWGDQAATGKPAGGDIRRKKKSFPVVYALEHANPSARRELIGLYKNETPDSETVARVLAVFDALDTRDNAQKLVDEYSQRGLETFASLNIPAPFQSEMKELVRFLTGRNF